ncbi:DUF808 domain-containing protein [Alteromonadaceae bacterium BrNp21-10]|nr:DUF808 domain-containing protein [Alteromonadaceae bacterium BrNp21-10]
MAGASLLMLLDDIAALLDDVAIMTKVAAKKTAGVLGDDLALNAQQVSGVRAERELPVVWAVAKGSLLNKLILVPVALLLSYFLPWSITPLLVMGGLFLCFEGVEKIVHSFNPQDKELQHQQKLNALADPELNLVNFEKDKIKGAIRTDFILSAEIIVIALGTVSAASIQYQTIVVSVIALSMTIGVYGLVAAIVKLDDMGLYLIEKNSHAKGSKTLTLFGKSLVGFAPMLMKFLTIAGTAAMFLVGGGILSHSIPFIHHLLPSVNDYQMLVDMTFNAAVGLIAGAAILAITSMGSKLFKSKNA